MPVQCIGRMPPICDISCVVFCILAFGKILLMTTTFSSSRIARWMNILLRFASSSRIGLDTSIRSMDASLLIPSASAQ